MIAVVVRCSAYYQWSLGQCSLALAGLDFKGWSTDGSRSKQPKGAWGRCKNASPLKLELCPSSRLLPLYWNTTTANFLRRYACTCMLLKLLYSTVAGLPGCQPDRQAAFLLSCRPLL